MFKTTKYNESENAVIDECSIIVTGYNSLMKKWTLPVIQALRLESPARFHQLKNRIPGITSSCLSERLNELVKSGVVAREVHDSSPPTVEYSLTNEGNKLQSVLKSLESWILERDTFHRYTT